MTTPAGAILFLGLFWPDSNSERARAALRQAVRFLRRELDPDVVAGNSDGDLSVNTSALDCDASAFERACAENRHAEALELYRGDFLAGLFIPDASPEFDEWLEGRRGLLRRKAIAAATALIAACRDANQLAFAVQWTRRAIGLSPDDEELQRTLFRLLNDLGDRAGALRAYEEFASSLERQLGVGPSVTTQALIAAIRAGESASPASGTASAVDARKGLALLTFVNMTGDPEQDFLCHALTEELRVALSRDEGIRVVPVFEEFAFKGRKPDLEMIRSRLRVDTILDGTVWRAGGMVRISAHLIDVISAHQLWAESFERESQHVSSLLDQIARSLAAGIQLTLTGRAPSPPVERPTRHVEAYNLYLRGRFHWNKRPKETNLALQYLNQAVELDPAFALAHAALADAYNTLGAWEASSLPPLEAFPKAHKAAVTALELVPQLAEAHTALGYASTLYLWDWDAAERQFRHAITLKPTYGHAHHWLSHLLVARGRVDESLESSLRALECDPLDVVFNFHLAWHFWYARQYDRVLEQCERTAELDSAEQWVPWFKGVALIERGEVAAAIDAHRLALERSNGSLTMLGALGYAYAVGGERRLARSVLKRLHESGTHRGMLGYEMGLIHGGLGETDQAFVQLQRALTERSTWLPYLGADPRLDRLRGDKRFAALLRAIGLDNVQTTTPAAERHSMQH